MPAFNAAATVGDAVASVLAQSRPDLELLVVDDGSTDDTRDVVERLARDTRVRLLPQENQGAAAARNAGVERARGRFIGFIDSDDLWLPRYLEEMGAALERRPEAGLAYTDAWALDATAGRIERATAMAWQHPPTEPPPDAESLLLELLARNFVYTAVTLPRDVFDTVGLFDVSLRAAIDYDMWLRVAAHGFRAVRPPGLLAVYRRGRPGSISTNRPVVLESLVRVYERVAGELPVSTSARSLARRRAEVMRAELAAVKGASGFDAVWRRRVRPALAHTKNRLLRKEGWLDPPPPEVVEAFPQLLVGRSDRTVSETA
jgi:glycosyltransferase involved in cell wall biosynthesis